MIEGTKINLRAIEDADVALFHRWFNDAEVTRCMNTDAFPAISLAQERDWIEQQRNDDARNFAIVLKDGTLIGSCGLRKFNHSARSCELGITIGEKAYWGQGYGGESLKLLLRIAFDGLNIHKVWLTCAAYNERGLRAYRRTSFREDGRLRDDRFIDGGYHDTVVMSILEDEWREQQT